MTYLIASDPLRSLYCKKQKRLTASLPAVLVGDAKESARDAKKNISPMTYLIASDPLRPLRNLCALCGKKKQSKRKLNRKPARRFGGGRKGKRKERKEKYFSDDLSYCLQPLALPAFGEAGLRNLCALCG